MNKLKTHHFTARVVIVGNLNEAAAMVASAEFVINRIIREQLNPAIDKYNEALVKARALCDEVVLDIGTIVDPEGFDISGWQSEWETIDLDPVEKAVPYETPLLYHADDLEALPVEPDPLF